MISYFQTLELSETGKHILEMQKLSMIGGKNEKKKITMLENKMNVSINEIAKVLKNGSQPNVKPSIYIIPRI